MVGGKLAMRGPDGSAGGTRHVLRIGQHEGMKAVVNDAYGPPESMLAEEVPPLTRQKAALRT